MLFSSSAKEYGFKFIQVVAKQPQGRQEDILEGKMTTTVPANVQNVARSLSQLRQVRKTALGRQCGDDQFCLLE